MGGIDNGVCGDGLAVVTDEGDGFVCGEGVGRWFGGGDGVWEVLLFTT